MPISEKPNQNILSRGLNALRRAMGGGNAENQETSNSVELARKAYGEIYDRSRRLVDQLGIQDGDHSFTYEETVRTAGPDGGETRYLVTCRIVKNPDGSTSLQKDSIRMGNPEFVEVHNSSAEGGIMSKPSLSRTSISLGGNYPLSLFQGKMYSETGRITDDSSTLKSHSATHAQQVIINGPDDNPQFLSSSAQPLSLNSREELGEYMRMLDRFEKEYPDQEK